jgi:hypothetical protein
MNAASMSRFTRIAVVVLAAAILLSAILLRALGLDVNPPGLWQDEASTGFDAYLLWTTGRDRAGEMLPVIAASFGDYPLALYRYLTAPIVGLFGITPATERAVACIAGSAMVGATGFFAWKVAGRAAAIGAMLSGALTPMWVHFSRYGSEAILLPFCLIAGAGLFEVGRNPERRWAIWTGTLMLAASAYTYHAVKLILPLWLLVFLIYHRPLVRELWEKERKHVIGPAVLFLVLVTPSVLAALTEHGMARGRVVMAWHHYPDQALPGAVLLQYLGYFEPAMMFIRGGPHLAQQMPDLGIFLLIDLPLIILGLFALAKSDHRAYAFIFYWFLIGPLPGALTYETQNVGRAIAWLPAPQLISGIGFATIVEWAWRAPRGEKIGWGSAIFSGTALTVLAIAWLKTGLAVFEITLVDYPRKAEREFQFEISSALRCARDFRKDERIIVAPNLIGGEVAETFIGFHFADLFPVRPRGRTWDLGMRAIVGKDELYVTRFGTQPKGRRLCEVRTRTGHVVAAVYSWIEPDPDPAIGPPRPKPEEPETLDSEILQ